MMSGEIRSFWKEVYGKRRRHRDDRPSAEEIAAKRWQHMGVTIEAILQRMKRK
jgi:hypothetical protein